MLLGTCQSNHNRRNARVHARCWGEGSACPVRHTSSWLCCDFSYHLHSAVAEVPDNWRIAAHSLWQALPFTVSLTTVAPSWPGCLCGPCFRHEPPSALSTSSSGHFLPYSRYQTETDRIREEKALFLFQLYRFYSPGSSYTDQKKVYTEEDFHEGFLSRMFQNMPTRDKKPLILLCTSSSCPIPSHFHLSRDSSPTHTAQGSGSLNPCNKPEYFMIACSFKYLYFCVLFL